MEGEAEPCKPEVRPGAREESASPAMKAHEKNKNPVSFIAKRRNIYLKNLFRLQVHTHSQVYASTHVLPHRFATNINKKRQQPKKKPKKKKKNKKKKTHRGSEWPIVFIQLWKCTLA